MAVGNETKHRLEQEVGRSYRHELQDVSEPNLKSALTRQGLPMPDAPARSLHMQAPLDELKSILQARAERARALGDADQAFIYDEAILLAERLYRELYGAATAATRRQP